MWLLVNTVSSQSLLGHSRAFFPPTGCLPCMMCIIYAEQVMTQDPAVRPECLFLCDYVKLSDELTTSFSFRSNVNYIPPPQEVSDFFHFLIPQTQRFFFFLKAELPVLIRRKHIKFCCSRLFNLSN